MHTKLQRIPKLAEILDVTLPRAYELVRTGYFPPGVVVRIGRQVRFDESALREWLASGGSLQAGEAQKGDVRDAA
jgi:excisionase family DNA binding protein